MSHPAPDPKRRGWINRTVVGITLATFFSDFGHEMATAALPLYLAALGYGPAALGAIEGIADFVVSISKLGGGVLGQWTNRKRAWTALGYAITALATASMGLARSVGTLLALRCAAWIARGYRGPLRDHLLADAVEPTHYGRAYGLERAGDMLGAVLGPLVAALLIALGLQFGQIVVWTVIPGLIAAASILILTRERPVSVSVSITGTSGAANADQTAPDAIRPRFPRSYWLFLIGVGLFGLGDFSRTFLIFLAAQALGASTEASAAGALSIAALLYAGHNLVSAASAYPIGAWGDRWAKRPVLILGYGLGVVVNLLLAISGGSLVWLAVAILLSGVYIAAEETLEKATVAQTLPRELRSLGLGLLAFVNAIGDMVSSLAVGWLLHLGRPGWAFGSAAACGALGTLWLLFIARRKTADR